MITKEQETKKYCCFYASEFHLEMILLPYIKDNIDKFKIIIYTQEDLLESMKIVLNRINLDVDKKNKILTLNWNNEPKKNVLNYNEEYIIIINGNIDYINTIEKEVKNYKKIKIIHCYNINDNNLNIKETQQKYDGIINTESI